MEEITIKEKKYKQVTTQVENGTRSVIAYKASDGKIFRGMFGKYECQRYEAKLPYKEIIKNLKYRVTDADMPFHNMPDTWYYAGTEEELLAIYANLDLDDKSNKYHKFWCTAGDSRPQVGDWIGVVFEDGGDSSDTALIYTWKTFMTQLEEYTKAFYDDKD